MRMAKIMKSQLSVLEASSIKRGQEFSSSKIVGIEGPFFLVRKDKVVR